MRRLESTSGLASIPSQASLYDLPTTEHTINDALAELLRVTRRVWRDSDVVSSENTGQLKGSNARPDILVVEPNVSPVVLETEVFPATTVESEATDRLGKQLKATGRTILSSIALRLPARLREKSSKALQKELAGATDLEMALFTGNDPASLKVSPRRLASWNRRRPLAAGAIGVGSARRHQRSRSESRQRR